MRGRGYREKAQKFDAQTFPGAIPVAQEAVEIRLAFMRKVYTIFLAALVATAGISYAVIQFGWAPVLAQYAQIMGIGYFIFLIASMFLLRMMGGYVFLGVMVLYNGLMLGMVFQMLILQGMAQIIPAAGIMTVSVFGGLTAFVFISKADFNWMRGILMVGLFIMIGAMIAQWFVPFSNTMHLVYCVAGVIVFAGFTLYDTSNIMRRYPLNAAAFAAAALFIDFIMMFWYILQILMSLARE